MLPRSREIRQRWEASTCIDIPPLHPDPGISPEPAEQDVRFEIYEGRAIWTHGKVDDLMSSRIVRRSGVTQLRLGVDVPNPE
jgi:hypothetical protein